MGKRRPYKQYLWDPSSEVPTRTKHRLRKEAEKRKREALVLTTSDSEPSDSEVSPDIPQVNNSSGNASMTVPNEDNASAASTSGQRSVADERFTEDPESDSPSSELEGEDDPEDDPPSSQEAEAKKESDEPLYQGAKLTRAESLIMVMSHSLRYDSSKESTESLLKLVDSHLPEGTVFPRSKFLFFKHFAGDEASKAMYLYCPECVCNLGKVTPSLLEVSCSVCSTVYRADELMSKAAYFVFLDIKSQVRDVLLSGSLGTPGTLEYDVQDITQSSAYHSLPLKEGDVSVTWNTDGVPLFESSNCSIWPLLLQVNELPYHERVQNLVLAGLWFGSKKPNMNCFLEPFVEVMNELSSVGVDWIDASGTEKVSRVFPGPCTVDTVARCMLMNMTQFNGAFGCAWCEAEGEVVEKGRGHVRVYPATVGRTRSHESFLHHSEKAERQGAPSHGVKGASILFALAFFNFASGFVVDYMHAVCSGFVRSTAFMWFGGRSGQHYHLGSFMSEIDMKLKALQPIWEMSRLPRSLKDMKYWKSSEWRSWMLFYSPVVLKGFLPKKYYDNWLKFVRIMHFLLGSSVPLDSLPQVKRAMSAFLKEFQELYGQVNMTYNAHLLLHLIDSVRLWGPLWGYSAYPFESMNGKLVRLVNGTRYVQCQVIDKFSIIRSLPKLWAVASNRSSDDQIAVLLRSLMKGYNLRKHVVKNGAVIFQGKGQQEGDKVFFKKARIGAFTYCVKALDKSRRKNSYVSVGGMFGQLVAIVAWCKRGHTTCSCVKDVTLRLQQLKVKDFVLTSFGALSLVQFVEVEHTNTIIEKDAASVQKCIVLCNSPSTYLCVVNDNYVLESV